MPTGERAVAGAVVLLVTLLLAHSAVSADDATADQLARARDACAAFRDEPANYDNCVANHLPKKLVRTRTPAQADQERQRRLDDAARAEIPTTWSAVYTSLADLLNQGWHIDQYARSADDWRISTFGYPVSGGAAAPTQIVDSFLLSKAGKYVLCHVGGATPKSTCIAIN